MKKIPDKLLEDLVRIANSEEVIHLSESHVSFPQTITKWQVVRVINAQKVRREK